MEKKILKFDIKHGLLRLDLYKAEGVRIAGRCTRQIDLDKVDNSGYVRHIIDDVIIQLDEQFKIGFKEANINNSRTWIKNNIHQINIRVGIPHEVEMLIRKLQPKAHFIND